MQRGWRVARRLIPQTDGERRWDHAYDRYIRWRRDGTWITILVALLSPEESG